METKINTNSIKTSISILHDSELEAEWQKLKKTLTPEDWTVGEGIAYYLAFATGWWARTGQARFQNNRKQKIMSKYKNPLQQIDCVLEEENRITVNGKEVIRDMDGRWIGRDLSLRESQCFQKFLQLCNQKGMVQATASYRI